MELLWLAWISSLITIRFAWVSSWHLTALKLKMLRPFVCKPNRHSQHSYILNGFSHRNGVEICLTVIIRNVTRLLKSTYTAQPSNHCVYIKTIRTKQNRAKSVVNLVFGLFFGAYQTRITIDDVDNKRPFNAFTSPPNNIHCQANSVKSIWNVRRKGPTSWHTFNTNVLYK